MKRFLTGLLAAFVFVAVSSAAPAEKIEGYNGIKWGTSVEEFKKKVPEAELYGTSEDDITVYGVYDTTNSVIRGYVFYKDKFYRINSVFMNVNNEKLEALIRKITDTYGSFTIDIFKKTSSWKMIDNVQILAEMETKTEEDCTFTLTLIEMNIAKEYDYARMKRLKDEITL